jgi:YfiH family protein
MIEVINPEIFRSSPSIHAFFTLSNRELKSKQGEIEGLNFGLNTSDCKSVVENNRHKLAGNFDFDPDFYAIAEQVHGDHIEIVDQPGLYEHTDGLITMKPDIILSIQVADCAAVMIADRANGIIGEFHAGWRGAVSSIVSKGVEKMKQLAKERPEFSAYISPCISLNNFEVGFEVAEQFPPGFVDYNSYKKPHVNLKDFLKNELIEAGLNDEDIEVSGECTMANPKFYSYRRERDKAGRMLACMYMKENTDSV